MKSFVLQAEELFPNNKELLVHCWRGGMRSEAMCWLLALYGWKVYQLDGGYKSFRNWVLQQFHRSYPIIVQVDILGVVKQSYYNSWLKQVKSLLI